MTGSLMAAGALGLPSGATWAGVEKKEPCLHFFAKPLQWLDFDQLAETLAEAGYGGIDLAVRPKGHIEPHDAATALPRAVAAAHRHGLRLDMIVTSITAADEPHAESLLKTAVQCGIKVYRSGYFKYDFKLGVEQTLECLRRQAADLAALNQRCGITGCYQNHYAWKDSQFGGAVWDLHAVIKELDPQWFGCQYDVRHAVAESHGSWSVAMRLIAPHIRSVCLKDLSWVEKNGRLVPGSVPSGQGAVPWETYFKLCREFGVRGPASVHCEWELLTKEEAALPVPGRRAVVARKLSGDAAFFKTQYQKYGVMT